MDPLLLAPVLAVIIVVVLVVVVAVSIHVHAVQDNAQDRAAHSLELGQAVSHDFSRGRTRANHDDRAIHQPADDKGIGDRGDRGRVDNHPSVGLSKQLQKLGHSRGAQDLGGVGRNGTARDHVEVGHRSVERGRL